MAKIIKKKFFEIDAPIINDKFESLAHAIDDLDNKTLKIDVTRQLRGKSVNLDFVVKVKDGKAFAVPKKFTLMPFFIKHMIHPGVDYVEDSFKTESKDAEVIIKPFFITRKRVSRAVRRTIRNSARNWLVDYIKTKDSADVFQEILSNQIQKPLGLKLKKIYPLAICEIRVFEIKKPILKSSEEEIGEIKIKQESKEGQGFEEVEQEISEEIKTSEEPKEKKTRKPKKSKEEEK